MGAELPLLLSYPVSTLSSLFFVRAFDVSSFFQSCTLSAGEVCSFRCACARERVAAAVEELEGKEESYIILRFVTILFIPCHERAHLFTECASLFLCVSWVEISRGRWWLDSTWSLCLSRSLDVSAIRENWSGLHLRLCLIHRFQVLRRIPITTGCTLQSFNHSTFSGSRLIVFACVRPKQRLIVFKHISEYEMYLLAIFIKYFFNFPCH